jgi:predicted transcriptional regulator
MGMTSVRVPDDMMKRLESAATRLRRSKGWVIKDALREYLSREELRIQRLEETRVALAEADAGEVIAGDAVLAWIDSWGTPDENAAEREPPH